MLFNYKVVSDTGESQTGSIEAVTSLVRELATGVRAARKG